MDIISRSSICRVIAYSCLIRGGKLVGTVTCYLAKVTWGVQKPCQRKDIQAHIPTNKRHYRIRRFRYKVKRIGFKACRSLQKPHHWSRLTLGLSHLAGRATTVPRALYPMSFAGLVTGLVNRTQIYRALQGSYMLCALYSLYFMPEPPYEDCGQKSGDYRVFIAKTTACYPLVCWDMPTPGIHC
jgi:hypothetical protein